MTKRFSIFAACLLAIILSVAAFAQDPPNQRNGRRHAGKLKNMDTNHDGQITREEWKGRDRGFQKADRNNDGVINREDARAGGRGLRKRQLRQMDTNQDKQINRSEWRGNPEIFSKLDKNNDGVITREEMRGRRRKT